jgi:hypothetical protein
MRRTRAHDVLPPSPEAECGVWLYPESAWIPYSMVGAGG